jgi:hypothetical protein
VDLAWQRACVAARLRQPLREAGRRRGAQGDEHAFGRAAAGRLHPHAAAQTVVDGTLERAQGVVAIGPRQGLQRPRLDLQRLHLLELDVELRMGDPRRRDGAQRRRQGDPPQQRQGDDHARDGHQPLFARWQFAPPGAQSRPRRPEGAHRPAPADVACSSRRSPSLRAL